MKRICKQKDIWKLWFAKRATEIIILFKMYKKNYNIDES